jgi:hypothetical protein
MSTDLNADGIKKEEELVFDDGECSIDRGVGVGQNKYGLNIGTTTISKMIIRMIV